MKRFLRPSRSESWPKNSAPMTSPIRYHQAMSATAPAPRFSVLCRVRSGPTLAAMVISRPSRIHAMPSATTSLVKNLDQGNRSIRAGIRLRIFGLLVAVEDDVVAMLDSLLSRPPVPACSRGLFDLVTLKFRVHASWLSGNYFGSAGATAVISHLLPLAATDPYI